MSAIITRFPPSPTGHLHIGGARTAVFNWLLARKTDGRFILRIEDTDLERSTPEMTESILKAMAWLGLNHDEGPYFQSQRFELYNEHIEALLTANKAYYCECTPDEVEAMRETARATGLKPKYNGKCRERKLGPGPGRVVRFKAPLSGQTMFQDMVKGPIAIDNTELDDMVIRRADGSPIYNLAVTVDDAVMGVTHILRGDDHISNTPKQILLYQAMGFPVPQFGHVPMILGSDKKKLSKRHGAASVMDYKDMGYLPEALINYLVRLGWSHGDQEIFSLEELKRAFSVEHLSSSACVFNAEKLLWVNAQHIKDAPLERLAPLLSEHLAVRGIVNVPEQALCHAIPLFQPRARTMVEMAEMAEFLFVAEENLSMDEKAVAQFITQETKPHVQVIALALETLPAFDHKAIEEFFSSYVEKTGIKFKLIAQPLRVALTGRTASPGLFEIMEVLGREKTLIRLKRAVS